MLALTEFRARPSHDPATVIAQFAEALIRSTRVSEAAALEYCKVLGATRTWREMT
jgi:hypothetical protein